MTATPGRCRPATARRWVEMTTSTWLPGLVAIVGQHRGQRHLEKVWQKLGIVFRVSAASSITNEHCTGPNQYPLCVMTPTHWLPGTPAPSLKNVWQKPGLFLTADYGLLATALEAGLTRLDGKPTVGEGHWLLSPSFPDSGFSRSFIFYRTQALERMLCLWPTRWRHNQRYHYGGEFGLTQSGQDRSCFCCCSSLTYHALGR